MKLVILAIATLIALPLSANSAETDKNVTPPATTAKAFRFEISPEFFHYNYFEHVNNKLYMEHKGYLAGANLAMRYHFGQNYVGISGRYVAGSTRYYSDGSGTMKNCPNNYVETRLTHGYNFSDSPQYDFVPFWGLGLRLLENDGEGEFSSKGHVAYLRESTYFYMPIGSEFTYYLHDGSKLNFATELDLLLTGTQRSYLYHNFTAINTQSNGIGFRLSVGYERKFDKHSIELKPFFRYWNIDDSDSDYNPYDGQFWREPHNITKELGIALSLKF